MNPNGRTPISISNIESSLDAMARRLESSSSASSSTGSKVSFLSAYKCSNEKIDATAAATPEQFELELERAVWHVRRSIIGRLVHFKST